MDIDKIIKEKETEMQEEIKNNESPEIKEENNKGELINVESKQELAEAISAPDFKPHIDTTKDMQDQAGEVINILGAQRASQDDNFMDAVSKNFQTGVLTDQETKNLQKKRLYEQEYFLKWQDVLQFAFIKSPHGLTFMKIMTVIAMLVYIPLRIIGMFVKAIGTLGEFVNEIFNSVFGGKGKYLRDKDGNVVVDPQTKKPYKEKEGYNLFAKLLFGIIIGGLALAIIFIFVRIFTGFDIFAWLRSEISNIA